MGQEAVAQRRVEELTRELYAAEGQYFTSECEARALAEGLASEGRGAQDRRGCYVW
jgi:hypothetical protein